jgi:CRP-like cAMP-binding protein
MGNATTADLRPVDLFDDLDDAALAEWAAAAEVTEHGKDEIIAEPDWVSGLQLLLAGEVRTLALDNGRPEPVHRQVAPTWMGAIAALTGEPLAVRLQTMTACRIAFIEAEEFRRLTFAHPLVHRRVMRQVAPVMGFLTSIERNRAKLESLGQMAAGLAHELNNPAAAAQRAADQLQEAMEIVTGAIGDFVESGIEREDAAVLLELQREAARNLASRTAVDALDAADAEEALLDCLETMGVRDAWKYADTLAAAGVDEGWIERMIDAAGQAGDAPLRWVAATLNAQSWRSTSTRAWRRRSRSSATRSSTRRSRSSATTTGTCRA